MKRKVNIHRMANYWQVSWRAIWQVSWRVTGHDGVKEAPGGYGRGENTSIYEKQLYLWRYGYVWNYYGCLHCRNSYRIHALTVHIEIC